MKQGKIQSTYRNSAAIGLVLLLLNCTAGYAVDRYVSLEGGHVPPFTDWASAATNIQEAIDASVEGDVIWVTNGVYAVGGKVMAGDLTNRVALDKALTVHSVNGPFVTTIRGSGGGNGVNATRCAWLAGGAVLIGFTLEGGATRMAGDTFTLRSGGGAWGASTNALIANCIIKSNAASAGASAVFRGTLNTCLVFHNSASPSSSVAQDVVMNSCTVISNSGAIVMPARLTNCIVYYNIAANYNGPVVFSHSCTTPLPGGTGNLSAVPQLLPDGVRLANTSPCRGAGTNLVSGTDLFGQPWANPPSIGCSEWQATPNILIQPQLRLTSAPVGFTVGPISLAGQEPFTYQWLKDGVLLDDDAHYLGTDTTNLTARGVLASDAGNYQVVVSNAFGAVTSAAAPLVIRFVSPAGSSVPPYLDWSSAANDIQDAIDAAATAEIVLVTNGVYASGGKVMAGDLTNRVALAKPITVHSVNGPAVTIIQGEWDPITTNGPAAVRGAWLTNGAILSGFTLTGGATRDSGDTFTLRSGGGVWSASTGASVQDCFIVGNSARIAGAGAYQGFLDRCVISNNVSGNYGGGAASSALLNSYIAYNRAEGGAGVRGSMLTNCAVIRNSADFSGGGASQSLLVNCTLTGNSARSGAGAQWGGGGGLIVNSVLWDNIATLTGLPDNHSGYLGVNVSHTCTTPLLAGTGNISANPQLLPDGVHLTETSPCRGAGNPAHTTGTDIDGQSWENPPAIGCDEWRPQPLMVADPQPRLAVGDGQARITAAAAGLEPLQWQWTKDGVPLEDGARYTSANTASLLINQFGVDDAGAYQVVVSNAYGMATSQVVQVRVACVDGASLAPTPPYSSWETAAANIQDAVDVAGPTDVVLVTNGVYATGGRVMLGDLTNRVVVDKPLLVMSVNGPDVTVIQGQWDPVDKVGPAAARCVWLENGAALSGFTLRDGATSASQGSGVSDPSGGGMRCSSTNAVLANCVITNCYASLYGGGAMGGTLSHCRVVGNTSLGSGGGAYGSSVVNSVLKANRAEVGGGGLYSGWLHNSAITGNFAGGTGGGVNNARLVNCTLLRNTAGLSGGGAASSAMTNCIVFFNTASAFPNIYVGVLYYSCTTPLASGPGNIAEDPQFVDGFHLSPTSPCRGMGTALVATGTDLEGETWANPPSMGCDEVWESGMVGPLAVGLTAGYPEVTAYGALPLYGQVEGRASRLEWLFGEGHVFTNLSYVTSHVWTNAGEYQVTFTAYNADNAGGATTNLVVHVVPLVPPPLTAEGLNGTNFSLSFPGQSGVTYLIEQTTNLVPPVTWQTVRTILSTGALMQVMDPRATNAMRFYRVRTP